LTRLSRGLGRTLFESGFAPYDIRISFVLLGVSPRCRDEQKRRKRNNENRDDEGLLHKCGLSICKCNRSGMS